MGGSMGCVLLSDEFDAGLQRMRDRKERMISESRQRREDLDAAYDKRKEGFQKGNWSLARSDV
eukprot:NODE_10258_length_341_cov_56.308219_g9347_i0.p4 GENE.NODE_10258_length_341_cov_56.308219_g9347_i0~~NODE_10258_length_341_cov_56.308219_g9347_i0.p4  ORF type:complete len:71 (+),score=31.36 NODE_10258_length_341_cov_56.308219_g9347_i0:25-213(+)